MNDDARKNGHDISGALNTRLREALARFLNNYPKETIAYFEPRMISKHYSNLFFQLLDEHAGSTQALRQYRADAPMVPRVQVHREMAGLFEEWEMERQEKARAQVEAELAVREAAMRKTLAAEISDKEAVLRAELEIRMRTEMDLVLADKERELQQALEQMQLQSAGGADLRGPSPPVASLLANKSNKRKSLPSNSIDFSQDTAATVTRSHKRNHSVTTPFTI
jgi:hypothetical protein